jgi:hypothetical protein
VITLIENNVAKVTIRWIARIWGIFIIILFLIFGIGEGVVESFVTPTWQELVLLFFIPLTLVVGIVIAWFKEVIGGIIIISSVLLFNITDVLLLSGNKFLDLDFGWLAILGLLFLLCPKTKKRKVQHEEITDNKEVTEDNTASEE